MPQEDVGFESYNLLLLKIYQVAKKKNKLKRRPDFIKRSIYLINSNVIS